jgi:2-aminoadipate transaminase
LNPGDVVLLGLPSYLGGINAFRAYRADLQGIPLDDDGMAVGLLEDRILELEKKGKKMKMIYVIPTFQNPAGVVMPESRRKKLVEIAREHDLIIVEDDPYSKLRFDGEPIKAIKAMDESVIYLATFSKILSPGFRLAFAAAPKDICRKMAIAKQSIDLCGSTFTQFIAYELMKRGIIDENIPKIAAMYKRKRDIMIESLEEYFPDGCEWTHPKGGMFLWVRLPENVSTVEMFPDALKKKVAYVNGQAFHVDGSGTNTMRLNFSNPSDEEIKEGIKRLGEVIEERI